MSVSFFPEYPNLGGWLVDVPNPGYGEVLVYVPVAVESVGVELNGPDIGEFLSQVTRRALGTDGSTGMLPAFLTADVAKTILPSLQRAAVLAAAGTDRYERTFRDDDEPPAEPLCSRCDEGTCFTPGALPSEWCEQYGHHPYGYGPDTRWDAAQSLYESRRERWERRREWARA